MLRKLNSILTIPTLLLFIVHLILMAGLLTGAVGFNPNFKYISYTLLFFVTLHVVIGLIFMAGRLFRRGKRYPGQNKAYGIQIFSGILMVVLVCIHMTAYGYTTPEGVFILREPTLYYYITECLLALSVAFHFMVSIPRLAISLGRIKETRDLKVALAISAIISLAILILAGTAFSLYYLPAVLGGMV